LCERQALKGRKTTARFHIRTNALQTSHSEIQLRFPRFRNVSALGVLPACAPLAWLDLVQLNLLWPWSTRSLFAQSLLWVFTPSLSDALEPAAFIGVSKYMLHSQHLYVVMATSRCQMNALLDAILKRRAVKVFDPVAIPAEFRGQILDAARSAPSSFNIQP